MGKRAIVLLVAVILIAGACGNASNDSKSGSGGGGPATTASGEDLQKNVPSDQPGVTDTEIRVGGVASKTNPLGGNYDRAFQGVEAYFKMINDQGGIYGRQLKLVSQRDDQLANNQTEVQALLSQDNVFAVLPIATLLFTGADTLAATDTPAFGWNINQEFSGPPNLFGERGSYICFTCGYPTQPWIAKQEGRTKVGILAYNVSQSSDCAAGVKAAFEKWPSANVVFEDDALDVRHDRLQRPGRQDERRRCRLRVHLYGHQWGDESPKRAEEATGRRHPGPAERVQPRVHPELR